MAAERKIICIACPRGCLLTTKKRDSTLLVSGNKCTRGTEYAIQEISSPMRILTSTVRTVFPDYPRLPVRTDKAIPLCDVFRYMAEINRVVVRERLQPGSIILKAMVKSDVRLLAADTMSPLEKEGSNE